MFLKSNWAFNIFVSIFFLVISNAQGQIADFPSDTVAGIPANYTEAKVGKYSLPDPLICLDGQIVDNVDLWKNKRRSEIMDLFEQNQFGISPPAQENLRYDVFDKGSLAFKGKAERKQITIFFSDTSDEHKMDLLTYIPVNATKPVPMLLYISFRANSVAVDDPGVKEGLIWNREGKRVPASEGRMRFTPLNATAVLDEGIGFATVYYGDIEPDFKDGYKYGLRALFKNKDDRQGQSNEWGAIAAWSWGMSRALDYFEKDNDVDGQRVALMGVSRLGKTVLWAGAMDQRFALLIPVCSGESGAALSRRNYGETIAHIAHPERYSYWFAPKYQQYSNDVMALPVDAHMLLSLLAPRPVLLITGNTDKWSDPYGEFLAAVATEPIYNLYAKKGLKTDKMPDVGKPILNDIGFYMHDGGHGFDSSDWTVLVDFLKINLK